MEKSCRFNNLELLRHGSFWLYLICVALFILLSFGSICYCSRDTVMAGIMVFSPLRSYNNLKGVEKLESIQKYENKKLKKCQEIHP